MKINKTNVEAIPPASGKEIAFYFDDHIKGFGVRVSGKTKTYIVQKLVKRKKLRVKLGRHGEITAEEARIRALKAIGDMVGPDAKDPRAEERESEEKQKLETKRQEITLSKVFEEYKKARLADGGLRPKTIKVYESALNRCFKDWLDEPISTITKDMIVERWKQIATTQGTRSKEGGAKAQAAQAVRTLKALMTFAGAQYENIGIEANPTAKLKSMHRSWSRVSARDDVIEEDQMADWYAAALKLQNDTLREYILFCFFTGLRRSTAAQLKWSHINKQSRILTIPAELDKTGKKQRLPIPDFVWEILEHQSTNHARKLGSDGYIFPSQVAGSACRYITEPKFAVAKIAEKSGVRFTMHTLRRTFATVASRLDISAYKVKTLLNHSLSGDVTGHHYVQTDVEQLREPMQRICDHLRTKCKATGSPFAAQVTKAKRRAAKEAADEANQKRAAER